MILTTIIVIMVVAGIYLSLQSRLSILFDMLMEERMAMIEALEKIAEEQKVYLGHGDYNIVPALTAEEAQALARYVLLKYQLRQEVRRDS